LAALPSDGAEAVAPASAPTSPPPIHASDVVVEVHRVLAAQQEVDQELAQLHAEHAAQAGFGDFDPDAARALGSHGVALRLYQFPSKEAPAAPAGTSLQAVSSAGGTTCAVLVGPPEATLAAREVPLPARSLAAIARALDAAQQRRSALAAELGALGAARGTVATRVKELEDELQLQQARAAMGSEQALAWITGFVPQDGVDGVLAAAARAGWAVSVCAPDAADVVPTKLQSKPWVRQVHAVLDMIGITPGYGEADVSALFLVFLVVFAAMLIGDAGYGALILFGVFLARRKWRHAPAPPFHLLRSVGVATVAWGVVTGTYFAIPTVPAFLDVLRIEWLAGADKAATSKHVMLLCFALGAIHITIAHLWSAWRMGKSLAALAQLGWIASTWCMFCIARTMVLGDPFPAFMIPVTVAGVAAVVLFMTPVRQLKDEWFNHVMLPLSLVSNFVDVVSYLRLFAVGTAGVAVASSFNDMAARIGADGGFSVVLAALVAIFGHTLNLVLCAMGVLVHGVRLNTLEFSAHMGLQWSGVPYRPLQRRAVGAPPTDLTAQSSITSGRT
jgi:V/A-type H+-transporting ATPase subunit I